MRKSGGGQFTSAERRKKNNTKNVFKTRTYTHVMTINENRGCEFGKS